MSGGEAVVVFFFKLLFAMILVGWIPALIASRKGRSFGLWWIYGGALFIMALIHSLFLSSKEEYLAKKEREKENRAHAGETGLTVTKESLTKDNYIEIEEFSRIKGIDKGKVVNMIRDGFYNGHLFDGVWFVNKSELE